MKTMFDCFRSPSRATFTWQQIQKALLGCTIQFYSLSLLFNTETHFRQGCINSSGEYRPTVQEIMGLIPELDEYSMIGVKKSVEEDTYTAFAL